MTFYTGFFLSKAHSSLFHVTQPKQAIDSLILAESDFSMEMEVALT